MNTPQPTNDANGPAPDFLIHLEECFGWTEGQAFHALSAYIFSTEAGRALRSELDASSARAIKAA